jgi:hypothetical protein
VTWQSAVRWALVAAATFKAVDAAVHAHWTVAGGYLLSAVLLTLHRRLGSALLAATVAGAILLGLATLPPDRLPELASNHVAFIGWVAAAMLLFDGDRLRFVLKVQIVTVYLFAGLNKINPSFLSGEIIAAEAAWIPLPAAVAIIAVAMELTLSAAVWWERRWALPLSAVFHVAVVMPWLWPPLTAGRFLLFNGGAVLLVAVATRRRSEFERVPDHDHARPASAGHSGV